MGNKTNLKKEISLKLLYEEREEKLLNLLENMTMTMEEMLELKLFREYGCECCKDVICCILDNWDVFMELVESKEIF